MSSTINTGAPTQIFGEPSSRARHARESAARAAAVHGASREGIRQAKALRQLAEQTDAPELAALADRLFGEVVRGERSLNSVYRSLITNNGQRRLLLTLPDWLDDRLRVAAAETGVSRQRLIVDLLTGWLAE
jgi:hypothetical protein